MIKREFLYLAWYLLISIPIIIVYIKFSARAKKEWLTLIGQIKPETIPEEQKREYIRLESAFPVEFQRTEMGTEGEEFDIHQGFTKDIGENGICIEILAVRGKWFENLVPDETKLKLIMNIPSESEAITATSTVKWVRKVEGMALDKYLIGVLYDDIAEPDLDKILKYALWFRRKPDILAVTIVAVLVLIAVLFGTTLTSKNTRSRLEAKIKAAEGQRVRLAKESGEARRGKEEAERELVALSREHTLLLERVRSLERRTTTVSTKRLAAKKAEELVISEEVVPEPEEAVRAEPEERVETADEPVVEVRMAIEVPVASEDEIVFSPNITRKMVESEKDVYKMFRNYILREEIQLLDRYCSDHKTSIYHAAGLFALAELRYKNKHIKEMIMKAYRDVIRLYPESKYASYASHRLEQIKRNLLYETYTLRYFHTQYNLPPIFDYRELEPYKE